MSQRTTSAERVILMALCNKTFLNALVAVPTFVDQLEELGMTFSGAEKTLLQGLSAERLAPYQHAFAEILAGKERRQYKAMAKSLLDQHAYVLATRPVEPDPEPRREITKGSRPDRIEARYVPPQLRSKWIG